MFLELCELTVKLAIIKTEIYIHTSVTLILKRLETIFRNTQTKGPNQDGKRRFPI